MQRRREFLFCLALIALLGALEGLSSAQEARARGWSESASTRSASSQSASSESHANQRAESARRHAARTPYERIFAPGLTKLLGQRRSGAAPTTGKAFNSAQASATSASATFGGFYAGASWAVETDAVAQADPNNWGAAWSASADFNKDGYPDVVTISYDGILGVVLNNGSGGFLAPVIDFSALPLGVSIDYLGVGDFNNDGYPDLIAVDTNNNQFLIFLNQGNGTFGVPTTVSSPANGQIGAIAIGDVNADGNLDIAAISTEYIDPETELTLQVFTGNGNGTFNQPTPAATTVADVPGFVLSNPGTLLLADVNNDQKLDLLYSLDESPGPLFWQIDAFVALGNNTGSFSGFGTSPPVISSSTSGSPNVTSFGVYLEDLNNDQKPDLVLSGSAGIFSAVGNGNGTFQPAQLAVSPEAEVGTLAFADVNGDGLLDLIVASNYLEVFPGVGDGTFGVPLSNYVANFLTSGSLLVEDFNGDGVLDIGAASEIVTIYFGKGAGLYAAAPTLFSPANPVAYPTDLTLLAAGDFTGNGNTDISVLYEPIGLGTSLLSGLGDGKGNFSYVAAIPTSEYPDLLYVEPAAADFNGDGKQDIVLVATHGVAVALSNGDGTFQTPIPLPLGAVDCEPAYAATADLTGNGSQDIVVAYPGDASCGGPGSVPSGYFVILGNGNGTFAAPQFYAAGAELYSITIADMNGDGIPDLLLDDAPFNVAGEFDVYFAPGSGNGTFGTPQPILPGYVVSQVLVTDFNQDGKPDLVMFCEGPQTILGPDLGGAGILLLPGVGDGTFLSPTQLATGTYFLNGVISDVNGDGLPDIVASPLFPAADGGQGFANMMLSTFLNLGGGNFSTAISDAGPVESVNLFAGNFLSDNAPDIVLESLSGPALFINQSGTLATLAASASSVAQNSAVVLTATIVPSMSGRPAPTGTVTFLSGSTSLGTATLSGGGASLSVTSLPVGTDSVTAAYSGDANFNPNSQAVPVSVTVTAVAPAFTMTSAPPTISLSAGQISTTTLTLTANNAFSGSVSLTATGLPQGVGILFTPSTVNLSAGQTATAMLVVSNSQSATAAMRSGRIAGAAPGFILAFALLPALLFMSDRKKPRTRARAAFTVVALVCAGMLSSCSSSSSSSNNAGSGQSTIANVVVTAAPSSGAASSQSITVTLTVQN